MTQRSDETQTRSPRVAKLFVSVGVAIALTAGAQAAAQTAGTDLSEMSLEDLMDVEVTSVSRRAERLADTSASVYVLTNDDIRRSGALSIPEALRLVPGLHVGQIDANGWSVSVRGFGGRFANKLLVLVDGRSVYSPLFSGVIWNLINVPLEEIDRIEIVRGPGATLWGADAVNGVINVITRTASSSQGVLVTSEVGSAERGGGSFRYGGRLNANASYRVDANGFSRSGTTLVENAKSESWVGGRVGVRIDAQLGQRSRLTLTGGSVVTEADESYSIPQLQAPYARQDDQKSRHSSNSLVGRWTRTTGGGEMALQVEATRTSLTELVLDEDRTTVGVDLQQTHQLGGVHKLIWGGSYARSSDHIVGSSLVHMEPDRRVLQLWSGFIQDDIAVKGDAIRVTLGSKLEHNDYTGWEVQPNARVRIALPRRQSLWASASRAVRLPNRAESDGLIEPAVLPPSAQAPLPQLVSLRHGESVSSEVLRAYEMGYRVRPAANLSVDTSVYVNDYSGLLTHSLDAPYMEMAPVPHLVLPVQFNSTGTGQVAGGEVSVDWRPTAQLRLQGGYSQFAWVAGKPDERTSSFGQNGAYPGQQVHARTSILLPRQVEVDAMARYVSELEFSGVPSYVTLDARVGTRVGPLDVSVIGRNLAGSEHCEYLPDVLYTAKANIQRSIGLRLRWQF